MQTQQIQQKGMLNQQLKTQTQLQQQHLENQINNNSQRVLQSQPGERNPARQQMLPNTNGGMLNSNRNPDSFVESAAYAAGEEKRRHAESAQHAAA